MARPLLYEGFVVLNCDVLFHPALLDDLLATHQDAALLIDYREPGDAAFGDEEMKVKVRSGRVTDMAKAMDPAQADGENLGIVKFGPDSAPHLVAILDRLVAAAATATGRRRRSASSRRNGRSTRSGQARHPWIEIDFPEDYQRAVREILPASSRRRRAPCGAAGGRQEPVMLAHSSSQPFPPHRTRGRGRPRVVAIGGGHGPSERAARGLRPLMFPEGAQDATRDRLVAVVATSDDGGSSGRLRAEFNMIPPGDIRNCLAALSGNESRIADLFQYRFGAGDGLNGHAIGNLVLAALADVTQDFAEAVDIAARILDICGVVLPATSEIVTLVAEFEDGRVLSGETTIARAGGTIARLGLLPERPRCSTRVCDADAPAGRDHRRTRQPLHEHPAAAAGARHRRRDPRVRARSGSSSRT